MGILSGNPQNEPMHYGKVFGAWSYVLTKKVSRQGQDLMILKLLLESQETSLLD